MRTVCVIAFAAVVLVSIVSVSHGPSSTAALLTPSERGLTPTSPDSDVATGSSDVYLVTITESGLAPGTVWSVSLNETNRTSTSTTVTFVEPNGTYPLYTWDVEGYSSSANLTALTVRGAPANATVYYVPPGDAGFYYVTFVESGLPFNVYWTVELCPVVNGTKECVYSQNNFGPTHDPVGISGVSNGTYDWTAILSNITEFPAPMEYSFPSEGEVVLHGSSVVIDLNFRYAYPFYFILQGVSPGTSWSFDILNQSFTGPGGTGAAFFVAIPNGTYGWTASAPGYGAQNGTVMVQGLAEPNTQTITLQALPPSSTPFAWGWLVLGLVVVVAAVCLALLVRRRRRDRSSAPSQSVG